MIFKQLGKLDCNNVINCIDSPFIPKTHFYCTCILYKLAHKILIDWTARLFDIQKILNVTAV